MRKIILGALLLISFFIGSFNYSEAYVSVKGHYRNGKYIAPHVRSNPNGLKYDNYSWTPSQGLYNESYGTRGAEWNTPTYVTDPDYYLGKSLYEQNKTTSSPSSYSSSYSNSNPIKPEESTFGIKDVSYVVKTWSDNNPDIPCNESTFLRGKERSECFSYRMFKNGYTWNVTTNEFDGKHYIYNPETKVTSSCPDGYSFLYDTKKAKLTNSCTPEVVTDPILPKGCTTKVGFSPITGLSCSSNSCALGMVWDGNMCNKK